MPYKFYELLQLREPIAKALVNHVNWKMCQTGPSIEMFEVREEHRGKGLGRRLLERIEEDARHDGFTCIRSTHDRSAPGFWKHMGYELDLDEGRKGLPWATTRTNEPLRTEA
ncbi:MAG: GNAT family N-acetyltransferase [Methanomassiliicoccales archaeon]|nr:GNAT family N-acetyltransferase [Methanomassiliicoccales archaeon]